MIYTFYSFKGGVGRSMALSNVAEFLYNRGARVLMIDWDLEAPGLESFFFGPEDPASLDVRSRVGLIDYLDQYRRDYDTLRPRARFEEVLKNLSRPKNFWFQYVRLPRTTQMAENSGCYLPAGAPHAKRLKKENYRSTTAFPSMRPLCRTSIGASFITHMTERPSSIGFANVC